MQIGPDDNWLCRTAPALTLYLPEPPACREGLEAWRAYAGVCPPNRMPYIMRKRMADYDEWPVLSEEIVTELYLSEMDRRRDQGIVVWDGGETSCWALNIEGVFEPDEPPQASFCQIIFPDDVAPRLMVKAAIALANQLPFVSGHAGHTVFFRTWRKVEAFDQVYAWAKRYWGLEVEDLNRTLPVALDGIKGANWLTLVGNPLWERLALLNPRSGEEAPPQVIVHEAAHGRVLVAGDQPILADRNRGEFPDTYAAVERMLQPIKIRSHPEFPGRFDEEAATMAWLNRLTNPDAW
jgi:Type VI immunity for VRR-NUC